MMGMTLTLAAQENNMIAYKIARLRVKIREKQEEQVRAREAEAAAWYAHAPTGHASGADRCAIREREQRRSRKISTSDKDQAMSDDRLTPALLLTPHNGVRAHPHSSTGSMRVSTPAQSGAVSLREDEDDIMDDY
jgi:hypothetical protein